MLEPQWRGNTAGPPGDEKWQKKGELKQKGASRQGDAQGSRQESTARVTDLSVKEMRRTWKVQLGQNR